MPEYLYAESLILDTVLKNVPPKEAYGYFFSPTYLLGDGNKTIPLDLQDSSMQCSESLLDLIDNFKEPASRPKISTINSRQLSIKYLDIIKEYKERISDVIHYLWYIKTFITEQRSLNNSWKIIINMVQASILKMYLLSLCKFDDEQTIREFIIPSSMNIFFTTLFGELIKTYPNIETLKIIIYELGLKLQEYMSDDNNLFKKFFQFIEEAVEFLKLNRTIFIYAVLEREVSLNNKKNILQDDEEQIDFSLQNLWHTIAKCVINNSCIPDDKYDIRDPKTFNTIRYYKSYIVDLLRESQNINWPDAIFQQSELSEIYEMIKTEIMTPKNSITLQLCPIGSTIVGKTVPLDLK